ASRHRSNSKSNNRQQSRSRSQYQPWNRDNLNNNNNNQHRRIPDANELDHYADGMDVTYPAPPTVLTDWKSIGTALEKVVEDLALFTTQFVTLNSRITKLESAMAASAPVPGPFVTKPPSYIPSSMQGWDDS
ncbi:22363_t:CDS:1, partial [Rhizophagus irregularis]